MKTSAISYRVADFLKGYPPFCYLDETARKRIAASGRVRYHERDEILYQQGKPREGLVRVIQQGLVRLSDGPDGSAETTDLRGEGEILGLGGYLGRPAYSATATVLEDTILYALDVKIFNEEVARSRAASQFLAAYYSMVAPTPASRSETAGVINWSQPLESSLSHALRLLLTCPADCAIRTAARQMAEANSASILVVDPKGRPLGVVTDADLRNYVATEEIATDAPVTTLLKRPPAVAMPSSSVGDALLTLMARGTRHLCLTEDGASDSRAIGAVSERDLMAFQGNNPMAIFEAIRHAGAISSLIPLRARIDDLALAGLRSPVDTDWYCQVVAEAHRALFQRILELTAARLGGFDPAAIPRQFALIGSAGRREMLTRTDLTAMLILEEDADRDRAVSLWAAVRDELSLLGCAEHPHFSSEDDWCGTLGDWIARFERWIARPVESDIYTRLAFFDFELLDESSSAGLRLREAIRGFLKEHPRFIRLLANDCFSNLPPVSIIRGFAIDTEGTWKETLDIKYQALQPVADVARVMSLDAGDLSTRSTLAPAGGRRAILPRRGRSLCRRRARIPHRPFPSRISGAARRDGRQHAPAVGSLPRGSPLAQIRIRRNRPPPRLRGRKIPRRLVSTSARSGEFQNPDDAGVRFVVFDLECTGTNPDRDRIVSIGAIAVRNGEIWMADTHEAVVRVQDITPAVLVHGITPGESESGLPEEAAVSSFLDYIGPSVLVGHHVGFDCRILRSAGARIGRSLGNASLDTMRITLALADVDAFGEEKITEFSLDGLCRRFRIAPHDRHTAPGDAFLTAQVFLRLLPLCHKHGLRIDDLVES